MFGIKDNQLPSPLKDESRLNVLFAPLRNKSVNPKDWADKISTWKYIIKTYCEANEIYFFSLASLNNTFIRNGRPPPCLKEVLDDMARNYEIESKDTFMKKCNITWSGWLTDIMIKRPFNWSYNTVKNTIFTTSTKDIVYVHVDVINSKSTELLAQLPAKYRNELLSFKDLLNILNKDISNADNIKLLLHNLNLQKKIAIKTITGTNINDLDSLVIKVSEDGGSANITDIDIGVYKLKENEQILSNNIEDLEDRIDHCIIEAKSHLQKNHKQMAKNSLIKKHALEKQLEKKSVALLNIQNCLEQLKGTHENVTIWSTYKNALHAFNSTYKETGLVEEAVDNTLADLADALDQHEDIQSALARPTSILDDTSDLEKELEDLMKEDSDIANTNTDEPPPHDDSGLKKSPNISKQEAM
ncbi:hypothetical protein GWI33_022881 [Rhynchophorus ferrugineus]|uniref:Charged multivesicular body protein 7 n=1 Tax=Rhynchophorus ferrugineus TaxID=354439 RepID=A0A834MKU7_RHYFE|nr:hypothetical protein GWI33_022881 [Rhynchophorus ferrugineus]